MMEVFAKHTDTVIQVMFSLIQSWKLTLVDSDLLTSAGFVRVTTSSNIKSLSFSGLLFPYWFPLPKQIEKVFILSCIWHVQYIIHWVFVNHSFVHLLTVHCYCKQRQCLNRFWHCLSAVPWLGNFRTFLKGVCILLFVSSVIVKWL